MVSAPLVVRAPNNAGELFTVARDDHGSVGGQTSKVQAKKKFSIEPEISSLTRPGFGLPNCPGLATDQILAMLENSYSLLR